MKDNFSKQSAIYAKYRPTYPPALYDFILTQVANKETAWDCGTGNGQAAKELSKKFNKVFATDISQKQIDNAGHSDNIFYSVQPAEKTDFTDNSFDLVTVAQALHWFRFDEFYKEVKRVTKHGGLFAGWTYSLLRISDEINAPIEYHHYTTLRSYWDDERKYVDEEYRNIPFPFAKIDVPSFTIEYNWTMEELEGYLNTWSALQKFITKNNYNPVDELRRSIQAHWKQQQMKVIFPVHLLLGRVEK
jgi:ubiquinone/menaquinone biosynthesis C-methylase UbiE